MKKNPAGERASTESTAKKTREKLHGLPFEKASDQKMASDAIRFQIWEQFERARIFRELLEKPEFVFMKDELKSGVSFFYSNQEMQILKVCSDGPGIKVSMNKDLLKDASLASCSILEAFVRSLGESFAASYYSSKGLVSETDLLLDEPSTETPP